MNVYLQSVFVDDQDKALAFCTDVLGFVPALDIPMGPHRWLTLTSPGRPDGPQVLLEPDEHPAVRPFKDALAADGIPLVSFAVDDVASEFERLSQAGVTFLQPPTTMGPATTAVLDDTCGNLIQIASFAA
jgi:catechol 2,3-dioxygenase-like lactoylglutathione lyase family enzyme